MTTDEPLPPAIVAGAIPGIPTSAEDWTADDFPLPLPGLEDGPTGEPALVAAVRRTIRALDAANVLTDVHAASCQLLLDLATGYARSTSGGRITVAASHAAAQIQSLLDGLPEIPEGGDSDARGHLVEIFRDARGRTASGYATGS